MNKFRLWFLSSLFTITFIVLFVAESTACEFEQVSNGLCPNVDFLLYRNAELNIFDDADIENSHKSFWKALTGGSVHVHNRFRTEFVNQDNTDEATAITNRLQLGYHTLSYSGFSGFVDFVDVRPVGRERYNAAGLNNEPDRAVIADPRLTVLNQMYAQFSSQSEDLLLRAGRQRIIHNNARFVGNVGWRQNEQTFDAITLNSTFGVENLKLEYSYVWQVNRIFGPDHPAGIFESDSHLAQLSYADLIPGSKFTAFAYHLEFENAPASSSQTFGFRLNGSFNISDSISLNYTGSYARQNNTANNPVNYTADYYEANAGLGKTGWVTTGISYELLGSDNGQAAFQTPLATLHGFQGWADLFLMTKPDGLQDISLYASSSQWEGFSATIRYHWFTFSESDERAGTELNASLSKRFNDHLALLIKLADFRSDSFLPDTRKLWLQAEVSF